VKGVKPTFISILAVGLLAGSAVGVAAQDESNYFQGVSRVLDYTDFGEKTEFTDGPVIDQLRGQVTEGVIETTDDRVSGATTTTINQVTHSMPPDWSQPAITQWGTERIENDGGAWECAWSGGEMQFMMVQRLHWCVGEGGYDGYAMRVLSTKLPDGTIEVVGLNWEGALPPLSAAPGGSSD